MAEFEIYEDRIIRVSSVALANNNGIIADSGGKLP